MCCGSHISAVFADGRLDGVPGQQLLGQDNKHLLAELGLALAILQGGLCFLVYPQVYPTLMLIIEYPKEREAWCHTGRSGAVFLQRAVTGAGGFQAQQPGDTLPRFGKTDDKRLLRITFTVRHNGEKTRVISARDMHRKERVNHEKAT